MEERNLHWNAQLEDIIAAEAEACRGYAWIHIQAEMKFSKYHNYISIPVIILSTLAGTASVGSTSLFAGETHISSIAIGMVSILVGILNTIQSYFAFSRKAEAHRISHLTYSKLFTNVRVELSLPRNERQEPEAILKSLRDSMERLAETTPTPPPDILEAFNKHFKDEDKSINRPTETNGLKKIIVFRENPLLEIRTPKQNGPSSSSQPRRDTPPVSEGGGA